MAEGSNGRKENDKADEPRAACAPEESFVGPGHPTWPAHLPQFNALMDASFDNKRKPDHDDEDIDKRHKKVDSQNELLHTLIATVDQMRQTQQQTFTFMSEMLLRLQNPSSSSVATAIPANPASSPQTIAEVVKAVTEATTTAKPCAKAKVPEELKQAVCKFMKKTGDRIAKNVKACKRLDLAKSDLNDMETPGRYPAGTRPFKSQADMIELDEILAECGSEDFTFAVTIPARSTRREALAHLHHSFTKECKRTNTLALEERVMKEKAMLKRSQIMQDCKAAIDKHLDIDNLGLDDPIQQQSIDDAIESLMEDEYGKIIQDVRKREQKTKEDAEKKKAQEEKEKQKILESHPSTLMKDAVESIVEAKFKEVHHMDQDMNEDPSATSISDGMEKACVALQKNGLAPRGGKGSQAKSSMPRPKDQMLNNSYRSWNQWQPGRNAHGYGGNSSAGKSGKSRRSWAGSQHASWM